MLKAKRKIGSEVRNTGKDNFEAKRFKECLLKHTTEYLTEPKRENKKLREENVKVDLLVVVEYYQLYSKIFT